MNFWHTPIGISIPYIMGYLPPTVRHAVPLTIWSTLERLTWPQLLAVVSFPVCFAKQVINCVQFWKASKHLVDSDLEERWEKKFGKGARGNGLTQQQQQQQSQLKGNKVN